MADVLLEACNGVLVANATGNERIQVDAINKLLDAARSAATELEALRKRCEAVVFELDCLRTQYEERTAYTIIHRGAALACSSSMRDAYSDEHHRAERLANALSIAHRHIDMAALRISHCKDAEAIAAAQEPSHG